MMAGYINRTISMIANERAQSGLPIVNPNPHVNSSPLQIFVKAKRRINDIFVEIYDYVQDAELYIKYIKEDNSFIQISEVELISGHVKKVKGIRDVLRRDHMKVAFFGRTSNGKSTVINAMLQDKILPSGIGHTTNCFLQVEGSENGEAYLITEDSFEKQNVKSVGHLANALCKEKLNESQFVNIFWPRDKCLLLRDDVVLVDSPGIDVTPNLDEWIDRHCLDADVFVLVANSESTLMITEKKFFHKVSTRLSKPNIFILNNRWDASASEPEFLDQVRAQHLERAVDFLVKELKVCTEKEAQERVFFVSAKEVLQARLQEAKGLPSHSGALAEGFVNRYFEFKNFEQKFEECISKTAVKTKFSHHSHRGKLIAKEIQNVMEQIHEKSTLFQKEKATLKKYVNDKLNYTEKQLLLITQEMKDIIHQIVEDVDQRISEALNEEIWRLALLVDEFNVPFHTEPVVLNVYKKELHNYVESGLGSNLRARLSTALAMNMENSQREMIERMGNLLPNDKKQVSVNVLPRQEPFEVLYRLNCDNLCADFKERLEFRFSWGILSFMNQSFHKPTIINYYNQVASTLEHPIENLDLPQNTAPYSFGIHPEDWSLMFKFVSVGSQGTVGGLLLTGFLLKIVGWRVILLTGGIFGCLYLYERLTWTNKAKEKSFKKQYINHTTKKLRQIVDLTSANCSHQVQQELSSTFARLCHLVDETINEMDSEIKTLDRQLHMLEEAANAAKVLCNKANYLCKELKMFDKTYLNDQDS